MKISILGLGYVGAVSLGCLVRDGHSVYGADIDQSKLDLIKDGLSPIVDEGMDVLMEDAAASGRVQVTTDAAEAVRETDLSFVCVGTPSSTNGAQNLDAIKRVAQQIGQAIKHKQSYHVVIVRSTIAPGTVEQEIQPLIEKYSGKQKDRHFGLGFQPEFLREGSSIKDYDTPPFTVVGADSEKTIEPVRELFGHLPCEFIATSIRSAEMLKYCCNVFHALKVTFANEIGRICQSLQVDTHEVMDLVCNDTRLNISRAYLRPGFAYGGSCLPKDLRALVRIARHNDVQIPMLGSVAASNRSHIEHAIETVLESGKKRIGMIGLSFKSGTDDLRESPLVVLAEHFIGKGLELKIYDPEVNIARLVGANRRYIEESIPHIASLMRTSCEAVIDESELLIVGLNNASIIETLYENSRSDQFVLDLVGVPDRNRLPGDYVGACW